MGAPLGDPEKTHPAPCKPSFCGPRDPVGGLLYYLEISTNLLIFTNKLIHILIVDYRAADEAVTTRRIWCRVGFLRNSSGGGKIPPKYPLFRGVPGPPQKGAIF